MKYKMYSDHTYPTLTPPSSSGTIQYVPFSTKVSFHMTLPTPPLINMPSPISAAWIDTGIRSSTGVWSTTLPKKNDFSFP